MLEKNVVGNWFQVGYSAPGVGSSEAYNSDNFYYFSSGTSGATWVASNKKDLNDCKAAGTPSSATTQWSLAATASGTSVQYVPNGLPACTNLTPAFANLSRATAN